MSAVFEEVVQKSDIQTENGDFPCASDHSAQTTATTDIVHDAQLPEPLGDGDTHCCTKCHLVFTSLDTYIKHKLSRDNCRVVYTKNSRWRIPRIVTKKRSAAVNEGEGEGLPAKLKRGVPRGRRVDLAHSQADIITSRIQYVCPTCQKCFHREAILRRHIDRVHNAEEEEGGDGGEVVVRPYDPTEVNAQEEVEAYDSTVYSLKKARCPQCRKMFRDPTILRAHMLTHSNLRAFPCMWLDCSYAFKTKGSLKRHMRRHTGERPYRCHLCNRTFGESGALTRHLRSRIPCVEKTDSELPRYRTKKRLDENIAANCSLGPAEDTSQGAPQELLVHIIATVDEGEGGVVTITEDGQQMFKDVTVLETFHLPHEVMDEDNVDRVKVGYEMSIDTSGVDGNPGEEEVVENGDTQAALANTCKLCSSQCDSQEALMQHLKTHLVELPFRCSLCTYCASNRDDLIAHLQLTHQVSQNESELVAPKMPDGDSQEQGLQLSKTDPEEAKKQSSDAVVALQQLLSLHESMSLAPSAHGHSGHAAAANPTTIGFYGCRVAHQCPVCERSFQGASHLRMHMRMHTGERAYKCEICEKMFTTKDTLNKHSSVHSEERQYKCGECGKLFKRISHVREHLKVHSYERPYPCMTCDKTFKSVNACKVHMRTHSSALPHACTVCARIFREKGSLERHMRTHTGEKPYSCEQCGRHFAEHGTLNRHRKAKVPCVQSTVLSGDPDATTTTIMVDDELMDTSTAMVDPEYDDGSSPSVLSEFSSVVADTQQYIIEQTPEPTIVDKIQQIREKFVMVHGDSVTPVNEIVEFVAEDGTKLGTTVDGADAQYIIMTHDGQHFSVVKPLDASEISLLTIPNGDDDDGGEMGMEAHQVALMSTEDGEDAVVGMETTDVVEAKVEIADSTVAMVDS